MPRRPYLRSEPVLALSLMRWPRALDSRKGVILETLASGGKLSMQSTLQHFEERLDADLQPRAKDPLGGAMREDMAPHQRSRSPGPIPPTASSRQPMPISVRVNPGQNEIQNAVGRRPCWAWTETHCSAPLARAFSPNWGLGDPRRPGSCDTSSSALMPP